GLSVAPEPRAQERAAGCRQLGARPERLGTAARRLAALPRGPARLRVAREVQRRLVSVLGAVHPGASPRPRPPRPRGHGLPGERPGTAWAGRLVLRRLPGQAAGLSR